MSANEFLLTHVPFLYRLPQHAFTLLLNRIGCYYSFVNLNER